MKRRGPRNRRKKIIRVLLFEIGLALLFNTSGNTDDLLPDGRTAISCVEVRKMHEIPKILTEEEFAKRLQLAKETLNEYNCKNDIEKGLIVISGWVSADGQPVYTPAQLKRLFDLVYIGGDTDGTENVADTIR